MENNVIIEAEAIELEELLDGELDLDEELDVDLDLKGFLKGPKGEPFTYDDFTPEQLEGLRGPSAVQVSPEPPTNDNILIWLDESSEAELAVLEGDLIFLTNTDIDNLIEAMA